MRGHHDLVHLVSRQRDRLSLELVDDGLRQWLIVLVRPEHFTVVGSDFRRPNIKELVAL